MRQIILALLFLLSNFATIMAQELTVKSFSLLDDDLSGFTNARYDNNGVACALIKVQLPIDSAHFEPNVMGTVRHIVNEYWVYLPIGSERLKIRHKDYLTKEVLFSDYGIQSLESKATYALVVSSQQPKSLSELLVPQLEKEVDVVVVVPMGGTLYIDGNMKSSSTWKGKLKEDIYTMEVRKPQYVSSVNNVYVTTNTDTIWLDPPTPMYGNLKISSNPDSATIRIDNQIVGTTPTILSGILTGEHRLILEKPYYISVDTSLVIEEGRVVTQDYQLSLQPPLVPTTSKKSNWLYAALSYNMISLPGPSFAIGTSFGKHQIEFGATLGQNKSSDFYNTQLIAAFQYKATRLQLKYGFEFALAKYFSIVPQAGMAVNLYHGTLTNHPNGYRQDLENAHSFSALTGIRFLVSINRRIKLHVTPEYAISIKKNVDCGWLCWYDKTCQKWSSGMNLSCGVIVNLF